MKPRSVIINADDFGLWPEVNDAVTAAYDEGIVTSASLRVSATASRSAIMLASMRPGLGVGLHLVLCEGQATLPRRHIPNLVDSSGRFVSRPLEAVWLYRRRGGLRDELKAEIRAQLEKFLASGLNLTHISGHLHFHLHPTVLGVLKELSAEYPIAALRRPCGRLLRHDRRYKVSAVVRRLETLGMRTVVGWGSLRAHRFVAADRVDVLSPTRPAAESEVVARLGRLRPGVTELVCHPGSLLPRYDGTGEAAIITSPKVRAAVVEQDLELISYRDIVETI